MFQIPVTSDPSQEQNFSAYGYDLKLSLRWNTVGKVWQFDLFDNRTMKYISRGEGLAVWAPSLLQSNFPLLLTLSDSSGLGLNAIHLEEMGQRINLHILSKDEFYEAIRPSN